MCDFAPSIGTLCHFAPKNGNQDHFAPNIKNLDQFAPNTENLDHFAPNIGNQDQVAPNIGNLDHFAPIIENLDHFAPNIKNLDHFAPNIGNLDHFAPNFGNLDENPPTPIVFIHLSPIISGQNSPKKKTFPSIKTLSGLEFRPSTTSLPNGAPFPQPCKQALNASALSALAKCYHIINTIYQSQHEGLQAASPPTGLFPQWEKSCMKLVSR
ncbi:unnamed protein product [Allacma fusca]|uniref:Uncharacterized protein n=1 Tax=Allacma fusca TaxID=39272 RepID=A0A8J2NVG8_9HEXA|nr:unnamed protein product [Allacma fusca]